MLRLAYSICSWGVYLFYVAAVSGFLLSLGVHPGFSVAFILMFMISIGFNYYNSHTKGRTFHFHYYVRSYDGGITFKRNARDSRILRYSFVGMGLCVFLFLIGLIPFMVMFLDDEPREYIKAALGSSLILIWCISQFYYCLMVLRSIKNRR